MYVSMYMYIILKIGYNIGYFLICFIYNNIYIKIKLTYTIYKIYKIKCSMCHIVLSLNNINLLLVNNLRIYFD